jgi:uncharacterized protein HemX
MPPRRWPARANNLALAPLVLAHRGRGRLLQVAALVLALLAGAVGSHLYWRDQLAQWRQGAVPMSDFRQAEQALAQARLQLQMAQGHGRGLEQQIDALNQRLRACLEEVTFFRKGRDTQR